MTKFSNPFLAVGDQEPVAISECEKIQVNVTIWSGMQTNNIAYDRDNSHSISNALTEIENWAKQFFEITQKHMTEQQVKKNGSTLTHAIFNEINEKMNEAAKEKSVFTIGVMYSHPGGYDVTTDVKFDYD